MGLGQRKKVIFISEEKGLRKLPSGKWLLRKTINKRTYNFTLDHKPGKREIDDIVAQIRRESDALVKGTFKQAAEEFITDRVNTLSPSTIKSYRSLLRNLSDGFVGLKMSQITQVLIQKEINTYAIGRSPKSVKNASGFITVVMWNYRPDMSIHTRLPQKKKAEIYIPTDDEVKKLVKAIKGSRYEPVILLCLLGLRRSEAISVTADDVVLKDDQYFLSINKATVINDKNKYVTKTTKTTSSTRQIWIPKQIAEMIIRNGKAYDGYPDRIIKHLHKTQDALKINRCTLHALRHYYITHCQSIGIPVAIASASVGHSNITTTMDVYTHAEKDKMLPLQQKAASILFE